MEPYSENFDHEEIEPKKPPYKEWPNAGLLLQPKSKGERPIYRRLCHILKIVAIISWVLVILHTTYTWGKIRGAEETSQLWQNMIDSALHTKSQNIEPTLNWKDVEVLCTNYGDSPRP